MGKLIILLLTVAVLGLPMNLPAEEGIRTVSTRGDINLSYYFKSGAVKSDKVLLIFPRGGGQGQFTVENNKIVFGQDFLVRSLPSFVKGGLAVVIVGLPSDQELMNDEFRASEEHYTDISKLCKKLAADGYRSIYLAASGSGVLSVALIANRPLPEQVKGIILAASYDVLSLPNPPQVGMLKLPVMIVHHQNDKCEGFSIEGAKKIRNALPKSTRTSFVTVSGGKSAVDDECENLSPHGFYGVEDQTVDEMLNWISGKPVQERINGK